MALKVEEAKTVLRKLSKILVEKWGKSYSLAMSMLA
jgi:hypothetical protein